jgi:hypothetical protein
MDSGHARGDIGGFTFILLVIRRGMEVCVYKNRGKITVASGTCVGEPEHTVYHMTVNCITGWMEYVLIFFGSIKQFGLFRGKNTSTPV